jgi:hypothetical protein
MALACGTDVNLMAAMDALHVLVRCVIIFIVTKTHTASPSNQLNDVRGSAGPHKHDRNHQTSNTTAETTLHVRRWVP